MTLEDWGILIPSILGGGTILGVGTKYSMGFIKEIIKMFKNISKALDTLEKIQSEFGTNGGATLKDAVLRIERRQAIQQNFIRHLLSQQPIGTYEADAQGNYTWVNPTYLDVVGRSMDDLLENGWVACIYSEDRSKVVDEWEEAIRQHREFNVDCRLICDEGIITHVRFKANPIKDASDKVIGYLGNFRIINK